MKHCIIVTFVPEITAEKIDGMVPEIWSLFENCTRIEGIHGVSVRRNCIDRSNRADLMIELDMEKEALEAYDDCEWHHAWKDQYGAMIASKTIFDYAAE